MNYQNFNEEVFRTKLSELDWSFVSENKDRNISFEIVCYYHVTYEFQSESTPCSLPECQGTPYLKQVPIWSLSDSNVIWTHNHLVCNQTLNHLARLARWLGCVVSTYLYGAFDCFLLPCMSSRVNLHSSLPECQGTPCLKQVPYLKFKWQQHDSNSWLLSLQTNTQPFSQTGQMIKLWCDYLSVWCI